MKFVKCWAKNRLQTNMVSLWAAKNNWQIVKESEEVPHGSSVQVWTHWFMMTKNRNLFVVARIIMANRDGSETPDLSPKLNFANLFGKLRELEQIYFVGVCAWGNPWICHCYPGLANIDQQKRNGSTTVRQPLHHRFNSKQYSVIFCCIL